MTDATKLAREALECARIKLARYWEQHGDRAIGGVAAEYDATVKLIDRALAALSKAPGKSGPVAWLYELAEWKTGDEYCAWSDRLTRFKPTVPAGAIRNLRPLYERPPTAPSTKGPTT